jgi:hypothetical protein
MKETGPYKGVPTDHALPQDISLAARELLVVAFSAAPPRISISPAQRKVLVHHVTN